MDNDDLKPVFGSKFEGVGRPKRTYPARRLCAEMDCDTVLSVYNPTRFCAQHETEKVMVRGKRRAS